MVLFDELLRRNTDLALLWNRLIDGKLSLVETSCVGGRCFATFQERSGERLTDSDGACILSRVLRGEALKVVASDVGVAVSTISQRCTNVLKAMGADPSSSHASPFQACPSRACIVLVMAALSAQGVPITPARLEGFGRGSRWVISKALPDETLQKELTHSEFLVARLAIEGKTHAEISRIRRTSKRTIANQLAAIFRKLGVSGRGELRGKALSDAALATECHVPPPNLSVQYVRPVTTYVSARIQKRISESVEYPMTQ